MRQSTRRLSVLLFFSWLFVYGCSTMPTAPPASVAPALSGDDANPIYPPACGTVASQNSAGCANFGTTLYSYLTKEKAGEDVEHGYQNFVYVGQQSSACLGVPVAGLTMTPTSCIAYNAGIRNTETGSILFPNASTCWVAMDQNTTGSNAGLPNFGRVAGTKYLTDCIDATTPAMPADAQLLMKVVTSGGAITAVSDLRQASANAILDTVTLFADQFAGADCQAKMQTAYLACPADPASCIVDGRALTSCTTSAGGLSITDKGNVHFLFPAGDFSFGAQQEIFVYAGPGKTLSPTFKGMGKYLTRLNFHFDFAAHAPGQGVPQRPFEITGDIAGFTQYPVMATINAGDTSFVVGAGDVTATGLHAGQWVLIANFAAFAANHFIDGAGFSEWKQVAPSYAGGTTVPVTEAFGYTYDGSRGRTIYEVNDGLVTPEISDMTITNSGNAYGIPYIQFAQHPYLHNINSVHTGAPPPAVALYDNNALRYEDSDITVTSSTIPFELGVSPNSTVRGIAIHAANDTCNSPLIDFASSKSRVQNIVKDCANTSGNGISLSSVTDVVLDGFASLIGTGVNGTGIAVNSSSLTHVSHADLKNYYNGVQVLSELTASGTLMWQPNHSYTGPICVTKVTDDGSSMFCLLANAGYPYPLSCTSGGTEPVWGTTLAYNVSTAGLAGAITTDGTCTWANTKYQATSMNLLQGIQVRSATNGINIRTGVTNTTISDYEPSSTVTTPILDAGKLTRVVGRRSSSPPPTTAGLIGQVPLSSGNIDLPMTWGSEGLPCQGLVKSTSVSRGVPSFPNEVFFAAPGAYWKCGEGSGNLADSTANVNTATAVGAGKTYSQPGSVVDDLTTAILMPGLVADYFTVASAASLPSADIFSVQFAFKRSSTLATEQGIISQKTNGFYIFFDGSDRLELAKVGDLAILTSIQTFTDTNWHLALVTKTGSTYAAYIDGQPIGFTNIGNLTIAPADASLWLGIRSDLGAPFKGTLGQIAVFPTALTATQSTLLYNEWQSKKNGRICYATDAGAAACPLVGSGSGGIAMYSGSQWCGVTLP